MRSRLCVALVICLALPPFVFADFQYQETTKITGGSVVQAMKIVGVFSKQARQVGQPVTSAVFVKGNRMAHVNPDFTQIVDLDKETITRIDHQNKTYTVMTFEQLKQQMERAAEEARKRQKEQASQAPTQPQNPPEMNFAVNVRNTGATKDVSGLSTKEAILTMTLEGKDKQTGQTGALNITNDMWLAPDVPGYGEVREFGRRYAVKMGMIFNQALGPTLASTNPAASKGMAEMVKEMSKLQGTPVLQITRMGSTSDGKPLPAASEAPLPPSSDMPSASDVAKQGAEEGAKAKVASKLGGIGGALGGFGGFGKKKKKEEEQAKEAQAQQNKQAPTAAVLLESSTEMGGFSSANIDDARFQVPGGYKQVEPRTSPAQ